MTDRINTKIIKVNPTSPEMEKIREAAELIKHGKLVAFPTETVYGLGASAFNAEACMKVYAAKNRPPDNPLIVHIADMQMLSEVAKNIPERIMEAMKKVWPGPITFILEKSEKVPDEATGGMDSVAVRMPAHPIALALIKESNVPIAAPSANLSTKPSPTNAMHVEKDLLGRIDMIIDGGDAFFGVESTIIDARNAIPVLLRPGPFTAEEIRSLFGGISIPDEVKEGIPSSKALAPGMKYRHYAPDKRLYIAYDLNITKELDKKGASYTLICSEEAAIELGKHDFISLGRRSNMYEIAKNLFKALRELDQAKGSFGVIEGFADAGIGLAIMNRIKKASGMAPVSSIKDFYMA
ncbi:MAG: L-threonylcarbamoyladenylate synthase [Candidatus Micrarchaeaceae archaeon]